VVANSLTASAEQAELFGVEHDSLQQPRLRHGLPERIYAERWKLLNEPGGWGSGGFTLLELILCPTGRDPHLQGVPVVSRRDAVVAACVIQWLGTNCGGAFLRETERRIDEAQERERARQHAEHLVSMHDWNRELQARQVFPLMFYRPPEVKTRRIDVDG
jgi:hypothetical protein